MSTALFLFFFFTVLDRSRTVKNTSEQMGQLCVDAVNKSIYSLEF